MGVTINSVPLGSLLNFILKACTQGRKVIISNANVHAINLAYRSLWFRSFLNNSDIVYCDGFGVKWAAKILHHVDLYRLTPPDWFPHLTRECALRGLTLYFLGARPGVAQKAASIIRAQFPELKIIGTHHGHFDKTPGSDEQGNVLNEIRSLKPNILVIGFGMPTQEHWIKTNLDNLPVNVILPVGAFFDYASGEIQRAPDWMTSHGFEWLGRLLIEPRRLWKRYVFGNPLFIWRVVLSRFGVLVKKP